MPDGKTGKVVASSKRRIREAAGRVLGHFGYDLVPIARTESGYPPDFDATDIATYEAVRPYTLTSLERVAALCHAVGHVVRAGVDGAFVECGVWRGGSSLAIIRTLLAAGVTDRDIYLYDTFDHMPPPGPEDVDYRGIAAADNQAALERGVAYNTALDLLPLDQVKALFDRSGYPAEHIHFVPGLVEETIPATAPRAIALLRLDTDYYQSTRHELHHLAPRVPAGGILLIDDYGHFLGCRQAVDEYVAEQDSAGRHLLLQRIDYSGRLVVMPPAEPVPPE